MGAQMQIQGALADAELISRSLQRPQVFAEIFDRHFAAVHRYLARRVGRQRADDLAAQTFCVAFARRATFRSETIDSRPWLFGIATNLLRNDRRAEQRLLDTLARLSAEPAAETPDIGLAHGVDPDLAAALAGLDCDQRDVLLLYAWTELSYDEIATALRTPVGTVRSRLSRARAHVRARLETAGTARKEAS
jgi:RNA polymerase sigma-70 factor (ECF subfamily)